MVGLTTPTPPPPTATPIPPTATPILGEHSLLLVIYPIIAGLTLAMGVCITFILRRDPKQIKAFRGGGVLHYSTVIIVTLATVLLGRSNEF